MIPIILFTFLSQILSVISLKAEPPAYCLQDRSSKAFKECQEFNDQFCENILCVPIENCDESENRAIVQNIIGKGCCPACVTYINEGTPCEVGAKLRRCRNGLFCDPSTRKCQLPPSPRRCMREVHNRKLVQDLKMKFYIEGKDRVKKPQYFELEYATDLDDPECDAQTGMYSPKQCRGSKCFCVDPETGFPTFGLSVKDSADGGSENVTCECADHFRETLMTGRVDRHYMEHYSQIHSKCDSGGNFEKLQCINATCFCANEKTGKPDMEKTAIYGALMTLPCFDKDRSETLHTKDSDVNYLNECERQLMRTQQLSLHFNDKGTHLIGLEKITCSFDGKFAPKQCKPETCNCVMPDDAGIAMPINYATDRTGGKDAVMNCQCAREVYYATIEKKGYARQQCDGNGNFKAYQSFDNGLNTYCVDENGSRISKIVPSNCFDQFVEDVDPGLVTLREYICVAMRKILTDVIIKPGSYFKFDKGLKDYLPLEAGKPLQADLYCSNSQLDACKCPDDSSSVVM